MKITPLVCFNRPYITISHPKGEVSLLLEALTVDKNREITLTDSSHNLKVIERTPYESYLYEGVSVNGLSYSLACCLKEDCVDLVFKLENLSRQPYAEEGEAIACLRKNGVPDFMDTAGERTYVIIKDKLIKVAELHGFIPEGMLHNTLCEQEGWKSSPELANTLIATVSANKDYVLGFAWDKANRISANCSERLNCIHSNVLIQRLKPGEEEICRGRIYFYEGSLFQLYERYKKDYEEWKRDKGCGLC